jgi:hypothetical protein
MFKGTVWPDWICMRVVPLESPLKGHQPLYGFDFLISVLNICNNFKVLSCFMQNWNQPPACFDHRLHRILSSYWLAHCYLMKKSTEVAFYFGLDWGMMKFFTYQPQSKVQLMPLPQFMEYGLAKKRSQLEHMQTVIRTSRRIGFNSAWSVSGLWSLLKYSRVKKKIKNL